MMKGSAKHSPVIVMLLIAVLLVGSIGFGFAYSAVTMNTDNNYSMNTYVIATDEYGDRSIQLPTTTYSEAGGGLWTAKQIDTSLTGKLEVRSPDEYVRMRVWIELSNKITWTTIQSITLYIDGVSRGSVYEYHTDAPFSESCVSTDIIRIARTTDDPGTVHTFQFRVIFRDNIPTDPRTYTGDNMKSKITFIAGDVNPIVTFNPNKGTGTTMPAQSVPYDSSDATTLSTNTYTAPDGKHFKEWNTRADGSGSTLTSVTHLTSDLTVYVIWEANE